MASKSYAVIGDILLKAWKQYIENKYITDWLFKKPVACNYWTASCVLHVLHLMLPSLVFKANNQTKMACTVCESASECFYANIFNSSQELIRGDGINLEKVEV